MKSPLMAKPLPWSVPLKGGSSKSSPDRLEPFRALDSFQPAVTRRRCSRRSASASGKVGQRRLQAGADALQPVDVGDAEGAAGARRRRAPAGRHAAVAVLMRKSAAAKPGSVAAFWTQSPSSRVKVPTSIEPSASAVIRRRLCRGRRGSGRRSGAAIEASIGCRRRPGGERVGRWSRPAALRR